jgi:G:T/U-mismatch repair DNA glycosylase
MKQLFLAIFFVAVSAGLFFAYIDPTYNTVKAMQKENGNLSEALDKSRQLQEVRDSLRAKYNTFSKDDLQKLQKLIPDHIDNIRFVIDLNAMAAQHGIRIQGFTFTDATEGAKSVGSGDTATPVTFGFSTNTDYATYQAFMNDLERSLRIIDITQLTLSADDTGKNNTYTVTIRTYWLK